MTAYKIFLIIFTFFMSALGTSALICILYRIFYFRKLISHFGWKKLVIYYSFNCFCDHCKRRMNLSSQIPVLGFFLVKGQCPYCQGLVSPLYPVLEAIGGVLGVYLFLGKYY